MGIVVRQSVQNTITTYIGFAIGALNTLFLYTNFLTDEYYGLVGFLLSAAAIMTPLMAFGVHNTLVKFYSSYDDLTQRDNFLSFMLYLPLLMIIPVGLIGVFAYESISSFLAKENEVIRDFAPSIFLIAIAMAYFEVFYAWSKVHMKSAFGNFMKEVFHRVVIMMLLFAVYFDCINANEFVWSLVGVYFLRAVGMKWYAYKLKFPKIIFNFPQNTKQIFTYSTMIIVAGSISLVLLDIDKVMIGKYIPIENVAYYNVAIFIAMVIIVPARAMHQITYPITAELLNSRNWKELEILYKKSSLTLFVISGWVFLMISLNVKQLYELIPNEYSTGLFVVLLISVSKLFDNLLGINNAILYNSEYYKWTVVLGVLLAILTITLNVIFIPEYGINGAAVATFISLFLYSLAKIIVVNIKFKMHPFSSETLKVFFVLGLFYPLFYLWDFQFHPLINIGLKSSIFSLAYFILIYKGRISDDINSLFDAVVKRIF
jgi:O-antigen/teichoic acid export membrane protein